LPLARRRTGTNDFDELPPEESGRRVRLRRGGPRTPLPLLPLIAVAAGIGVAYVGEVAHATKATYQESTLAAREQQLHNDATQLQAELARLQSSERIVAAAQGLGMRPANKWAYAPAQPVQMVAPPPTAELDSTRGH
jgi:cell division protein FtsL